MERMDASHLLFLLLLHGYLLKVSNLSFIFIPLESIFLPLTVCGEYSAEFDLHKSIFYRLGIHF